MADPPPALHVAWSSDPSEIPGEVTQGLTVDAVTFEADHLRVVGDASPGFPRTFRDHVTLAWSDGVTPDPESFEEAPPGLYSVVAFELDAMSGANGGSDQGAGEAFGFEITGTVEIRGEAVPYRIRDTLQLPLSVSIDPNIDLQPGGDRTIEIQVDVEDILDGIKFDDLPEIAGERVLATGNPAMNDVRKRVTLAFETR